MHLLHRSLQGPRFHDLNVALKHVVHSYTTRSPGPPKVYHSTNPVIQMSAHYCCFPAFDKQMCNQTANQIQPKIKGCLSAFLQCLVHSLARVQKRKIQSWLSFTCPVSTRVLTRSKVLYKLTPFTWYVDCPVMTWAL